MKIKKKLIKTKNKNKIYSISLINDNNFKLEFLNFGCYIKKIIIPYLNNFRKFEDIIIGYENLKDIFKDNSSFNSTIGRVAGRISKSKFTLKNKTYKLSKNDGNHHIHGGNKGFNKKIWKIINLKKNNNLASCKMYYESKDLEEGYPGNLKCYATYTLNNKNQFVIEFKVKTDKETIVNLTNHNYWNFNGHRNHYHNISNHLLKINSNRYCEVDNNLLVTGKIIKELPRYYNFKRTKFIGKNVLKNGGIDNYFICNNRSDKLKKILEVSSPLTKMGMILYSNQKGIQFYTGNNLKNIIKGKKNKKYGKNFGVCFEAQNYPNSINIKNFPNIILKKNKIYKSKIIYHLKNDFI